MVAERGLKTLGIAQDWCISLGRRSFVEVENKSKEISGQLLDWDWRVDNWQNVAE